MMGDGAELDMIEGRSIAGLIMVTNDRHVTMGQLDAVEHRGQVGRKTLFDVHLNPIHSSTHSKNQRLLMVPFANQCSAGGSAHGVVSDKAMEGEHAEVTNQFMG
jgi:hypothetical protein